MTKTNETKRLTQREAAAIGRALLAALAAGVRFSLSRPGSIGHERQQQTVERFASNVIVRGPVTANELGHALAPLLADATAASEREAEEWEAAGREQTEARQMREARRAARPWWRPVEDRRGSLRELARRLDRAGWASPMAVAKHLCWLDHRISGELRGTTAMLEIASDGREKGRRNYDAAEALVRAGIAHEQREIRSRDVWTVVHLRLTPAVADWIGAALGEPDPALEDERSAA